MKNAWTRFEEEGIVTVVKSKGAKVPPRAKLCQDWTPRRNPETGMIVAEGRLWDFIETIALSRREGKNRKDGATVSTRVVRLTDMIGKTLFDSGFKAESLSEEDKTELSQRMEKRKTLQMRANL